VIAFFNHGASISMSGKLALRERDWIEREQFTPECVVLVLHGSGSSERDRRPLLGAIMPKFQSAASALTERLHELESRVQKNNAEICAPEDADMSEQAVMDANDEPLEALNEASLAEMESIKSALARIENGRYGLCTHCGDAIHAGRLEAMPTAAHCISCAEEADQLHHRL
jgi:DnaK suppressor protein